MKKKKTYLFLGVAALVGLFLGLFLIHTQKVSLGAAPSGLPAGPASSSQIAITVGTLSTPIASSTTGTGLCSSRVIATASTTIMVGIGNIVPNASLGYFVAASTTKEFDGGIYGCGAVKIFPFATGAITATDNQ